MFEGGNVIWGTQIANHAKYQKGQGISHETPYIKPGLEGRELYQKMFPHHKAKIDETPVRYRSKSFSSASPQNPL